MRVNINSGSFEGGQAVSENNKLANAVKNALLTEKLSEGDVFRGKIQDIIGNNVKINLGEGRILYASMENGVDFNIGENIQFLVKSNDGNKVLLQSLPRETLFDGTIINSLKDAGITLSSENINMVKEMMAYGMAIDSNGLAQMEKLVNMYPGADVSAIVAMKSHNIPINEDNINQFQSYKNYQHKMTDAIGKLTEEIFKLTENADESAIKDITETINRIIKDMTGSRSYEEAKPLQNVIENNVTEGVVQKNPQIQNIWDGIMNTTANITGSTDNGDNQGIKLPVTDTPAEIQAENAAEKNTENRVSILNENPVIIEENMTAGKTISKLKEAVKELKSKWMPDTKNLAEQGPEELKKGLKDIYESMAKGTERLMETLRNNGMEKTDAYKSAENIKSNIQFMNDFNQVASYVQVPFKTYEGEANGELYVYNRNKNKTLKDGPITAFLHLDLENLGATDIKVTMDKSRVKTIFTLEDLVSQNIVEENLPWLKERLEKLGYSPELTVEEAVEEKKVSPFEKIMEIDKPRKDIKRYSFDIRL